MTATTVAVSMGKGGVLKTSITANLAGLAAAAGWRVLAVDGDRQGHLSIDLGVDDQSDGGESLARAIMGNGPPTLVPARPGLDLICGGSRLDQVTPWLISQIGSGQAQAAMTSFQTVLADVAADRDLVLIDCPPGMPLWVQAIYAAVHWVLVPSMIDEGSIAGLDDVGRVLASSTDQWGGHVQVLGVVLTGLGSTAAAQARRARAQLEADLAGSGIGVLDSMIHHSRGTATECRRAGLLVHELEAERTTARGSAERSALASSYDQLAVEVMGMLTGRGQEVDR